MKRRHMYRLVLAFALGAFFCLGPAVLAQGNGNGKPRTEFDEDSTPLQRAIEASVETKRDKERLKPRCQKALEDEDPEAIEKHCKLPKFKKRKLDKDECPDCGDMTNPAGKVVGKKIKTETVLEYKNASKRDDTKTRWDNIVLGDQQLTGVAARAPTGTGASVRDASFLPDAAINEDRDCLELATGRRFGGPDVADGDPDSCFDADGLLKDGMDELVDEDGPEAEGEAPVDQDGDGRLDEDPPLDQMEACIQFAIQAGLSDPNALVLPDGSCDLTRAIVAGANQQAMEAHGKKLYKANAEGEADPEAEGEVLFGDEEREVTLSETFTVICDDGLILVDGQCVPEAAADALDKLLAGKNGGAPAIEGGPCFAGDSASELACYAMMGFTFAPPVLEWGYEVKEKACVLGVCAEIFFARIGYEFAVALGLRLPVEVQIDGLPDPAVLAGDRLELDTAVQPLDFTAAQYREFCEQHRLDDDPLIADCEIFGFTNWLEAYDPFAATDEKQGDEFVARITVFAGLKVRVLGVPLITWGLDVDADFAEWCSYLQISQLGATDVIEMLADLGSDASSIGSFEELRQRLKEEVANCGSFTTPFGFDPEDDGNLRAFPFAQSFSARADCAQAILEGEVVNIRGKVYPVCTNLLLGVSGASLGVGLGLDATVGSDLITADWAASGDADPAAGGQLSFNDSADRGETAHVSVVADNYDGADFQDHAFLELSDMTYFLNTLELALSAQLQFGGILSPIPDLPSLEIYRFTLSLGDLGIPIGQHNGTDDLKIPVLVENYALEVDATPATDDPELKVDDKTLKIKPGEFGDYRISVENVGSFAGGFDNFLRRLSNQADQSPPFTFVINPDNDGDGLIDEDPPGPEGALLSERDEDGDGVADEDAVDDWRTLPDEAGFQAENILGIGPYETSTRAESLILSISPFRHPLTAPGIYPFRVTADSIEAKANGMAATDPAGNRRTGAGVTAFIQVEAFFDPQIAIQPATTAAKPGAGHLYTVEGTNGSNVEDSMTLATELIDFNPAACDLVTLGSSDGCPYRAVPTVIQAAWTDVGDLPGRFESLAPLGVETATFGVTVPADWAGMEDTVYQIRATVVSLADDQIPAGRDTALVEQTVIATKESMTRFIGLEIDALIAAIEAANAAGVKTGGLLPIAVHPLRMKNDRALELIAAGDLGKATKALEVEIRLTEAFLKMLDGGGKKLPAELRADFRARAEAILGDLPTAVASQVPSGS